MSVWGLGGAHLAGVVQSLRLPVRRRPGLLDGFPPLDLEPAGRVSLQLQ